MAPSHNLKKKKKEKEITVTYLYGMDRLCKQMYLFARELNSCLHEPGQYHTDDVAGGDLCCVSRPFSRASLEQDISLWL